MMDLKTYQQIKKQHDQLQREADKAEGVIEQLMSQLKEEFGCNTVEEAEEMLEALTAKAKKNEHRFNQKLKEFQANYGHLLKPTKNK